MKALWIRRCFTKKWNTLLFLALCCTSCYEDTQTDKCARERKFNFQNECRNVEQMEPLPNVAAGIRWYSGTERFSPCYNPNNANEIAFCLVVNYDGTRTTRIVIANLETGEHRLVKTVIWSWHSFPVEWSRKNTLLFADDGQWMVFDTEGKDTVSVLPPFSLNRPRWNVAGDKIVSWIGLLFDDKFGEYLESHEMASISWPDKKVERVEYFRSSHLPHHGHLAISPKGDYFYVQATGRTEADESISKWISADFRDSGILYQSTPKIGCIGDDYELHPNETHVYFANEDDGIFFIEKGGTKQCRIKKGCPNRHYERITISPLGDKIIAQRRDIAGDAWGNYESENTKLVIMDIDGCNEEVLFEDWDGVIIE